MSDEWYYGSRDNPKGPISTAELKALADSGGLQMLDPICRVGSNRWTMAIKLAPPEVFAPTEEEEEAARQALRNQDPPRALIFLGVLLALIFILSLAWGIAKRLF